MREAGANRPLPHREGRRCFSLSPGERAGVRAGLISKRFVTTAA